MYSLLLRYGAGAAIALATFSIALPTNDTLPKPRSLVKRALPEFNWDFDRPNAKNQREKAGEAWVGMIALANMVYHKNADPNRWPRIFKHYFNERDQIKVDKVFSLLVGEGEPRDPHGGAAFMKEIVITNNPPGEWKEACNEKGVRAYTFKIVPPAPEPPKFAIVICDAAYEFPLYTQTGCDKLGDKMSGLMDTLDGIILHEMTHMDAYIGIPATGQHIEDHGDRGYGPLNTRRFKDNPINEPTKNADNYRIYAQELFWTELCGKEFGDATDNTPYPGIKQPTNDSPPPSPPLPAAAKTNALSIILQKSLDEIGAGSDWLFFPGRKGEAMLCHDQKDSWSFTSDVSADNFAPWPAGTFHFDDLFDRVCEYKNDGQGNPGMLWCKDKDKDVGIECYEDSMRTTKEPRQCTKSGLIPSIEHVAVAYCEW